MTVFLGHIGGCLSLLGPFSVIVTLCIVSLRFAQTPHVEGHPVLWDLPCHFILICKISSPEISNYAAYGRCFGPGVLTSFSALLYCKTKDSSRPDTSIFHPFAPCLLPISLFLPPLLLCLYALIFLSFSCHFSDPGLSQVN